MPTPPFERDTQGQDPYAEVRAQIEAITASAQAAIDHFNSSLVGINGDLETAHEGRRAIIDAENEARRIRSKLGFQEMAKRDLDFCSGTHQETPGKESVSQDEQLRRLGAIPSTELTPIAYMFLSDPDQDMQAGLFCEEHTELGDRVSTIDLGNINPDTLTDALRQRTEHAFETYRGQAILDVLEVPKLELPQGAKDIKQALHPEQSVSHEIWPIVPFISGDPHEHIARYKPQPTTKTTP